MNRVEQPYYKPRTVYEHKIDLKNKSVKKIWVKKSYLNCCVASTSLKTVSTNSWYFNIGYSRHMTSERKFLKGVSKENEVVYLIKEIENLLKKTIIAPSIATETDPESEIEPPVITTSTKRQKWIEKQEINQD